LSELENLKGYFREHVYRYSEQPFRLSSGKESHHYFNCKVLTLHPLWLLRLADYLVEVYLPKKQLSNQLEAVGGLTMGADPLSYAVSLSFARKGKSIYPLVIRKESKGHGTEQQIEGFVKNIKTCLVLEDVVTTGASTLKAVRVLRQNGIEVTNGLCLLDREEDGMEALQKEGIQMHSLFRRADFL